MYYKHFEIQMLKKKDNRLEIAPDDYFTVGASNSILTDRHQNRLFGQFLGRGPAMPCLLVCERIL